MKDADCDPVETRVLVLAPTAKDGQLTRAMLARAGIACVGCCDAAQVCEQLAVGAGAVLIAEEAVHGGDGCLAKWLGLQPAWSDLPVLVLARAGADSPAVARAMDVLGNVTVIERPTRVSALVSAVRSALRARRRQYQLRDELVQRQQSAEQLNMAMAAAQAGSWQINVKSGAFSASDHASVEAALQLTLESGVVGLVQDITERKLAEQARHALEQNYRALTRASSEITYRMSADWSTMLPLDGRQLVASSDQTLVEWAWLDLNVPPEEHPRVRQAISDAIAGKTHFELEHRVRRPDGSIGWTFSRAVPIFDENEEVVAWFGAASDITERKQSQQALSANEERLRMALAASQAGAWEWEVSTGSITWSPQNYLLYGYDPVGGPPAYADWEERIHPDDRTRANAAVADALAGRTPEFRQEFRVAHPTRGERWLLGLGQVEFAATGEPVRMFGINLDITAAKQAEVSLRASEHRLRLAMEASSTGLWDWEVATGVVTWSPECYVIHKVKDGEFDGTAAGFDRLVHPDDRSRVWATVQAAINGRTRYASEFRIVCPDGEVRWVANTGRAVYGPGSVGTMVGTVTDITDRKQADAERESEQTTLITVVERCPFGIYIVDEEFRLVSVNAASEDAAFVNVRPLVGRPFDDVLRIIWPEPVAADIIEIFRRTLATGEAYRSKDFVNPRADVEQTESYEWEVHRITLPSGRQGAVCYYFDATKLRAAEKEVRDGEQRMRLATDATGVGVWQWNVVTDQIRWDAQMFRIYGVPPTTDGIVHYETWSGYVLAEDLPRQEEVLQDTMRRRASSKREFRIRRVSDGECRVVESVETVRTSADGEVEWVLGTNLDVTDRRRSESALRESEARLGGILLRSPAGILQTDAAGSMTLVNPRWLEMLGLSEAELLGRNILEITHPSFVAPTAAAFGRLAAGGPDFEIEKAYCRKDGSTLRAQSNVAAIRSPSGEFLGLIAVVVDISERLRSEEELRQLGAELAEADRRKDVFLATLAHELRNPLAPIRTGLQVMKLSGTNGETFEKIRAMMDRQVSQLVRLVDDLLDVSRFSQGKVELRKERVELKAVIEAAVETSRPATEQAGHQLAVVVPDEPIFVDGDPTRLAQVVSNLLNNSAKYTHRGGHVQLTVGREDGTAVVSVKDDGIGIPPKMLDKVFVMFNQVDRALEKTTGGLGIGLSLVKGLLEMHGGTIEAKSDGEGMGSEFVVRLPVVTDVVAGPQSPVVLTSEVTPSAHLRILVVDDNVDAADSLGQLLELSGHEVRTAENGEVGIEVAAQFRPDVVLMDIGMPKLNGYEAARRIRQHPWSQGMVLVALTGWGQEHDRRMSAGAGFDHHLVKPVDIDVLTKLLSGLESR